METTTTKREKHGNGGMHDRLTIDENREGIRGKVTLHEDVVATIAGMAAREVPGIHSLGRSRLLPLRDLPSRGVSAEVGMKQAAFDIDVIIDYGCDLKKVAAEMRRRIADEVGRMAGRQVVEVNINVIDIKLPTEEKPAPPPHNPRVE
jgi:uncharacterized alkaline shock family protein YloU